MTVGSIPLDDNGRPVLGLWNDATGQVVPVHIGALVTGADGKTYARLDIANASIGADGSATPASSTLIGGSDGTNLQALLVESAAHPNLRAALYNGTVELLLDAAGRALIGVLTTTLYSAPQAAVGSGNSGDLDVSKLREVSIDLKTTAQVGTNPTIQFFWNRKGIDGVYYPLWQSDILTAAANTVSTSVGPGLAYNQSLGATGQLSWVVGGTASPNWTFTPNVYGK